MSVFENRERESEREMWVLRFVNVNQLLKEKSGGWKRTDGGRGALRINALFHFKVRESRYWRRIFTHGENKEFVVNLRKTSGRDHG